VRSTVALHNLINNKIDNLAAERKKEKKDNQKKDKKDKVHMPTPQSHSDWATGISRRTL
jgi:hypothetical protein